MEILLKQIELKDPFDRASIIPFCKINGVVHYLFGIDRKFEEYTDLGGGVKKGESFLEAAIRELKEETLGLLNFSGSARNIYSVSTCALSQTDHQSRCVKQITIFVETDIPDNINDMYTKLYINQHKKHLEHSHAHARCEAEFKRTLSILREEIEKNRGNKEYLKTLKREVKKLREDWIKHCTEFHDPENSALILLTSDQVLSAIEEGKFYSLISKTLLDCINQKKAFSGV